MWVAEESFVFLQDNITGWIERKGYLQACSLLWVAYRLITSSGQDILESHFYHWSVVSFVQLHQQTGDQGDIVQYQKTGLWCTISWNQIISPIFFNDIVSLECYCKMIITHSVYIDLYKDEMAHGNVQQDNAAARAHNSWALMCSVFRDRIILKDMLPPCWPDLTPPDHYPWWIMNCVVYKDSPHILLESIADFIWNIPPMELSCVFASKKQHADAWLHICGGHFQNFFVM